MGLVGAVAASRRHRDSPARKLVRRLVMAHQTFPKPTRQPKAKNRTVTKRRQAKRRKSEAVKRDVYTQVDERDGSRCVPCQIRTGRNSPYAVFGLQHHHILPRSRGGTHTLSLIHIS